MTLERMLKNYGGETKRSRVDPEKLQLTVLKSKEAFLKSEEEGETAWLEFLYQQAGYIQKRWWLGQGALLFGLWMILYMFGSRPDIQRSAGILTSAFVILALPELWKNRSSHSMEVEGAAYFSLRKIYAARLLLFGAADVFLLSVFFCRQPFFSEDRDGGSPDSVHSAYECHLRHLLRDAGKQEAYEPFFFPDPVPFLDGGLVPSGVQRRTL